MCTRPQDPTQTDRQTDALYNTEMKIISPVSGAAQQTLGIGTAGSGGGPKQAANAWRCVCLPLS